MKPMLDICQGHKIITGVKMENKILGNCRGEIFISGITIPCFVLKDGRRVISDRGMTKAIGMKARGQGIPCLLTQQTLKDIIGGDLETAIRNPIKFIGMGSRKKNPPSGYEATILYDICQAILKANDEGKLKTEQEKKYAQCCHALVKAFAKTGINALVDEATGYQEIRDTFALQEILAKYIPADLMKWQKRFPEDFYKELFKLKGLQYNPLPDKKPWIIGRITKDIIYERLAPGIIKELEKKNPPNGKGVRPQRHHQWWTEDLGNPKLAEHIISVIALMKASLSYTTFYRLLQRSFPKYGDT
jgi:hypothetical protein